MLASGGHGRVLVLSTVGEVKENGCSIAPSLPEAIRSVKRRLPRCTRGLQGIPQSGALVGRVHPGDQSTGLSAPSSSKVD